MTQDRRHFIARPTRGVLARTTLQRQAQGSGESRFHRSLSLATAGGRHHADKPDAGPDRGPRFTVTFQFPK